MQILLNIFIFLVVYSSSLSLDKCKNCDLLKIIFQDKLFYTEGHSLYLGRVDTITILDKYDFFRGCDRKVELKVDSSIMKYSLIYDTEIIENVRNKVVIIKTQDLLPTHLINGTWTQDKSLNEKYENYFILDEPKFSGDSLHISLFRLRSNHQIDIVYKLNSNKFERLSYSIGQY